MAPAVPHGSIEIGLDTLILDGVPISLASEAGALTVLHGALQSAIASVEDACAVEAAYQSAMAGLSTSSA